MAQKPHLIGKNIPEININNVICISLESPIHINSILSISHQEKLFDYYLVYTRKTPNISNSSSSTNTKKA